MQSLTNLLMFIVKFVSLTISIVLFLLKEISTVSLWITFIMSLHFFSLKSDNYILDEDIFIILEQY